MLARISSPPRVVRGAPSWSCVFTFVVIAALILPVVGSAQGPSGSTGPVLLPNEAAAAKSSAESYVAEVIGNDVRIRSGAGTNYYECGKLYTGDRVQVVKSEKGWSCIVPPPGCFSWISMQYVSINLENPTMGVVTGDNVGVYTGSDFVEPMHSTSKQVVLNRGQTVKLLGEEKDDYYKIAPPQGAHLWVSSQFLQAAEKPPVRVQPPVADANAPAQLPTARKPVDPNAGPLPDLDQYYALSAKVKAEHGKPVTEQNYAEIKKKLAVLAAVKDGGRAARYADYTLKQVERFELACRVAKEVDLQNKELQKTTEKIDQARRQKLGLVPNRSKFALMGKLENSSVYDGAGQGKRYRILDDAGKTVCYVAPTGPALSVDFSKYVGHKVGLVGKIEPHDATSRAFIEFTEIVLLEE